MSPNVWTNRYALICSLILTIFPVLSQVLMQLMWLFFHLPASGFNPGAARPRFDRKSGVDCPNAILVWLLHIQELWMDIMPPALTDFPLLGNTDFSSKEPSNTSVAQKRDQLQSWTGNEDWTDGSIGNLTSWSQVKCLKPPCVYFASSLLTRKRSARNYSEVHASCFMTQLWHFSLIWASWLRLIWAFLHNLDTVWNFYANLWPGNSCTFSLISDICLPFYSF